MTLGVIGIDGYKMKIQLDRTNYRLLVIIFFVLMALVWGGFALMFMWNTLYPPVAGAQADSMSYAAIVVDVLDNGEVEGLFIRADDPIYNRTCYIYDNLHGTAMKCYDNAP